MRCNIRDRKLLERAGNYPSVILLLFAPTIFSGNTRVYTSHYAALALLRCKAGNREKSRFMAPPQPSSFFFFFTLSPTRSSSLSSFTFRLFPLPCRPYPTWVTYTRSFDLPLRKRLFLRRISLYQRSNDKRAPSGIARFFCHPLVGCPFISCSRRR